MLVFNHGDQLYELDAAACARLSPQQATDRCAPPTTAARRGFQYPTRTCGSRMRASNAPRHWPAGALRRLPELRPHSSTCARRLVGRDDITFADAQATCYREGHFSRPTTTRCPARTASPRSFNFTAEWRADRSGQLRFVGEDGAVVEGWVPRLAR